LWLIQFGVENKGLSLPKNFVVALWQDIATLDFQPLRATPLLPTTKSGGIRKF
jgi:hypothetical protein